MWKKIGIGFAILFVVGLMARGLDMMGLIEIDPPEPTTEEQAVLSKVKQHAYNTGLVSARAGVKKPSSDELDAIIRKAAVDLGELPDRSFKSAWKYMFWQGWQDGGG